MKLFVITIDEPIYINKFVKDVIEMRRENVVGVAILNRTNVYRRKISKRVIQDVLIGCLIFSLADIVKILYYKVMDGLARYFKIKTHYKMTDICADYGIPVYLINDPNDSQFVEFLRGLGIDIILHQTPVILRREIISAPTKCIINRHMSCLPEYRGVLPVFWQFYNRERNCGISIHMVNEYIDSGKIVIQKSMEINERDTISSVYKKLFLISAGCADEAINIICSDGEMLDNDVAGHTAYSFPKCSDLLKFILKLN